MNIKFKKVYLRNFFSFDEAEIDLTYSGYTLVSGLNNNKEDMAKSNGSGKSSIWESIIWCLTGDTIRGTRQVVNQLSTEGTKVELYFNIDQNEYKIIRYKEDKEYGTNLKFYINNEDKSGKGIRDTEKILEDYLPDLNAQLLGSVIILGQGLPQRFTNNTPSGRKEILEKLSKSDYMIEDIKTKLSNRKIILNEQLRKIEDIILSDNSKKEILESQLQKLKEDRTSLVSKDYNIEIEEYKGKLASYIEEKQKLEIIVSTCKDSLDKKFKEYETSCFNINEKCKIEYQALDKEYNLDFLHTQILNLQFNIKQHESEINRLEAISDICPTCGQKIPDVHKIDTSSLQEELNKLLSDLDTQNKTFENLRKEYLDKKEKISNALDESLQNIKKEKESLENEYNINNKKLQDYNKQINDVQLNLDKLKLNKETYENQIKTIDKDIEETEIYIKQLNENILYNNKDKDNIKTHQEVVNKMLTIATRDFRGVLLSEIITYINLKAKEYSQEIFETDKINFTLDNNNINISYLNKDYENLSGGEKQKIDLIIQFSIRDMLSQFLNFSSNILVLDEIFDNLDDIGCQKVLNLISNKLNDIEGIYIITHHSDISIPSDRYLLIIKNNKGISRVQ